MLNEDSIRAALKKRNIERGFLFLDSAESTNTMLKERTEPEGFFIAAAEQTAGRGRLQREFVSPKGGIYFSILTKNENLSFLPFVAVCAVCEAVFELTGISAVVKWVNDIFVGGRKLCGILVQSTHGTGFSIVGIGVNVNSALPDHLNAATLYGYGVDECELLAEIIFRFETLLKKDCKEVLEDYKKRLFILGREVEVIKVNERFIAQVVGLDEHGALIVERNGETECLISGDISLKI